MILDKIIKNKQKEVEFAKVRHPLDSFKGFLDLSKRDFKRALKQKKLALIGEIKKESPSSGMIRKDFDPVSIAEEYKESNVAAISVLTDKKYFNGDLIFLKQIRREVKKIPLLRKDFIIDEYQIYESRYYNADAVLLIARILTKEQIDNFIAIAKMLSMGCVVEVHDEDDLDKVLKTKADIIGINNRDLDSLRVNLNTTLRLAEKIPKNKIIIAESGYNTKNDINKIRKKANAVLIGTSLLKAKDIKEKIKELGL